jgi:hypothetical protein
MGLNLRIIFENKFHSPEEIRKIIKTLDEKKITPQSIRNNILGYGNTIGWNLTGDIKLENECWKEHNHFYANTTNDRGDITFTKSFIEAWDGNDWYAFLTNSNGRNFSRAYAYELSKVLQTNICIFLSDELLTNNLPDFLYQENKTMEDLLQKLKDESFYKVEPNIILDDCAPLPPDIDFDDNTYTSDVVRKIYIVDNFENYLKNEEYKIVS